MGSPKAESGPNIGAALTASAEKIGAAKAVVVSPYSEVLACKRSFNGSRVGVVIHSDDAKSSTPIHRVRTGKSGGGVALGAALTALAEIAPDMLSASALEAFGPNSG